MEKLKLLFVVCLSAILLPTPLVSQDIEELLSKYTSENGEKYMQPFADAFSANLNSGLFHNAKLKKMGFQIYFGLETQLAVIPSSQKTMTATTEGDFFPKTRVNGVPTVFGPTDGLKVEDDQSGTVYAFPGGLDIGSMPMATPQLTIGSVFGTNLTFRYAGTNKLEDVGKISLFGWGVRHSIDQYLPLPVNLALGYYNQKFSVGEYIDATSALISLQTSYSIPVVTFYGGLGYEMGSMSLSYTYEDADTNEQTSINFDLTPSNKIKLTGGFGINLGPVNFHAEYNLAKQSSISAGLGIGFGDK